MFANLTCKFRGIVGLLGVATLSAACSSSSTVPTPNGSAGAGGLSSSGGAPATTAGAGEAGAAACPDFRGVPVVGPGPGSGCDDGACFSCITPVQGLSFAAGTFSNTDASGVTSASLQVEPGRVCMAGASVNYAILTLVLSAGVGKPFDAPAHDITQVGFTVETPPSTGVVPSLAILLPDLSVGGSDLTSNGQQVSITSTTPEHVPLSDFQSSNVPDDPSRILAIGFGVGAVEHFDFCVSKLKFFNANDEIAP